MTALPQIDAAFHHPARLQIAAVCARVDEIEFATLRDILQVSDSVLSKHLSAMSDAGYIGLRKAKSEGRQRTWAAFTRKGKRAFAKHMQALRDLANAAQQAVAAE